jgi:hypothetical protein
MKASNSFRVSSSISSLLMARSHENILVFVVLLSSAAPMVNSSMKASNGFCDSSSIDSLMVHTSMKKVFGMVFFHCAPMEAWLYEFC